jgi:lysophospholipase L1-like esterase
MRRLASIARGKTISGQLKGEGMSRATRAKRIAVAAAFGTGSVGAAGLVFYGVLIGQALNARRMIPVAMSPPPRPDGLYGATYEGEPLRLAVLGDSAAAGFGVHLPRETVGAVVASGLAERLRRPVQLKVFAVVGAQSVGLPPQVEAALEFGPEAAFICIGGNDVTGRVSVPVACRFLADAVRALRAGGSEVVVGTCPDLGTIRPIQPPLRWLTRLWSRQMAAAQTIAVVEAGGRTVSLGDLLGPTFYREPELMFSYDRFHPSAAGYEQAAAAILPTLVSALVEPEPVPTLASGEGVRTLPQAAVEAARSAGTEVSGASVDGREHGPAGRWAQLRRRVWHRPPGRSVASGPALSTVEAT